MIKFLYLKAYKFIRAWAFIPAIIVFLAGIIFGVISVANGDNIGNALLLIIGGTILAFMYLLLVAMDFVLTDSVLQIENYNKTMNMTMNNLNASLKTLIIQTSSNSNHSNAVIKQNSENNSQTHSSRTQIQRQGLNIRK